MKRKLLKCLLFFIVLLVTKVSAQDRTVTGVVSAKEDGLPIPGVSVKLKGTPNGVVTGANGRFTIKTPTSGGVLVFSYVGYNIKEVTVSSNNIDVALESNTSTLDEVVVSAGGIKRTAREQGYASTRVDGSTLTQGKSPNIAGGLVGKVPGLQINAVSSGVNPNYRLVLRGNRSLTGNNQALIVLDNVVVPNELLGNLNPEDIEDITVLNGASGAALYGSDASNGALLVTTKKGKKGGAPIIKLSNTSTWEEISFYPKLQNKFGSGSTSGSQVYDPIENQQFGPAFDGSVRQIGVPLYDGSVQNVVYSANDDKYDFWDTGYQNQTDFSISSGDDKGTSYLSAGYMDANGTTPKDLYNRFSIRANGTRNVTPKLTLNYNVSFVENKYDLTTATSSIYDQLLQTPAQIPLLSYQDWENNPFANPNGYYNGYYLNPYYTIDNYRSKTKNSYLTGQAELKYAPTSWLNFTYRAGISNRYYTYKSTASKFTYTDYTKSVSSSKTDIAGGVSDEMYQKTQFSSDFLANIKKDVKDFSFSLVAAATIKTISTKDVYNAASGLQIPEVYNIGNRVGEATATESNTLQRQYGVWGDFTAGYKKYLFLHLTARNDWVSVLSPANRSFFYPSADLSFIPTDAIDLLKNSKVLDYMKLRVGVSKVGLVNVSPYALEPTFGAVTGYSNGTYYTQSGTLVSNDLKPEITTGYEFGTDFRMFKDLIDASFTFYHTKSTNQAIYTGVSYTTGFSSYYINTGRLDNTGIETAFHISPIRKNDWKLTVGGNFTWNENKVKAISQDLSRLSIGNGTYGIVGYSFPVLLGTDYARDSEGRVIVDKNTGYPTVNSVAQVLGNTQPKYRLGLDMSLSWKGFTLTNLFEYRGGYVIYSSAGSSLDFSGSSARSAYYNREKFVFPNSSYYDSTTGTYVANNNITVSDGGAGFWASGSYNRNVTSNYVFSGNYWKWREVSLAYKIPSSVLKKVAFIKSATVSAQGRNLFLWVPKSNEFTDPDYSSAGSSSNAIGVTGLSETPPTRYYGGTISLTF